MYIVFVVIYNNFTYVPRWNMRIYVVWHVEHGFTVTVIYLLSLCMPACMCIPQLSSARVFMWD